MQNLKQNIKIPKVTSNSNNILHLLNEISLSNNAPSIPSKNQSYGYEVEEYSGKLILQDMDIPGYKGTKGDTVGPGDYNPNHESIMKNKVKASFTVRISFIFQIFFQLLIRKGRNTFNFHISLLNDSYIHRMITIFKKHIFSNYFLMRVQCAQRPVLTADLCLGSPGPGSYNSTSCFDISKSGSRGDISLWNYFFSYLPFTCLLSSS